MQRRTVRWVEFHNNHARLTANGVVILMERAGWGLLDLHKRTIGIPVEELSDLMNGYSPKVRFETLFQVARVFGFPRLRARLTDLPDELQRFFESQTRQMP